MAARRRAGVTLEDAPQPAAGEGPAPASEPGQLPEDPKVDAGVRSKLVSFAPAEPTEGAPPLPPELLEDQSHGRHAGYVVNPGDYSPVKVTSTGRGVILPDADELEE